MDSRCRSPAVAGLFYSADPAICRRDVQQLLDAVPTCAVDDTPATAVIAPHAGHVYSGAIAARAYGPLLSGQVEHAPVAILAPNHRVPLVGMALADHSAFRTPLGTVDVATDIIAGLSKLPETCIDNRVHAGEHAIEVHLPFLQVLGFAGPIVPVVVGRCAADTVAELIARLISVHGARLLVSSDLSHFLGYAEARRMDGETTSQIERLAVDIRPEQACGCAAINGLNCYARRRHWRVATLAVSNSGDTAGDRSRVVGYGAYVYRPD